MVESPIEQPSLLEDRFWEAAARVAVVGGILLPLAGYAVRFLSLALAGEPTQLALAVAPARAATVGAEPFLLSLISVGAIVRFDVFGLRQRPRRQSTALLLHGWRRGVAIAIRGFLLAVLLGIGIAFIGVLVSYTLAQPLAAVPLAIGLLAAASMLRAIIRRQRPVSLASVGPATAVLVVASGLSAAIGPAAVLDVSDYEFRTDAAATNSRYATVGDADGWLFLRSCSDSTGTVVAVPATDVSRITLSAGRVRASQATLGQILGGGRLPVGDPCSPRRSTGSLGSVRERGLLLPVGVLSDNSEVHRLGRRGARCRPART